MNIIHQFPDRTIQIEQKEYLYFGGTAYLSLPTNKKFQKIITSNIQKWGTSYGSSRNANIQLSAYGNAEKYLAKLIQADEAITVSSGSLAGKLVIEQLTNTGATFFYLPNHHNAIQAKESFPVWVNNKINPLLLNTTKEKVVILTDAVPTSCIKPIDLSFIEKISETKEIILVIDESHSLGIIGETGCGIFSNINYPNIKTKIMISSLGKGFGITGGVIAGNSAFIDKIKIMGNFVSAAGMNPAFAMSIAEAKNLYFKQLVKLRHNLIYIDTYLKNKNSFDFDVNYPIIYAKNKDTFEILKAENIIITNFKYPNDLGYLNRIIITANHQKNDLNKLVSLMNTF